MTQYIYAETFKSVNFKELPLSKKLNLPCQDINYDDMKWNYDSRI